jgi:hypothetical protein
LYFAICADFASIAQIESLPVDVPVDEPSDCELRVRILLLIPHMSHTSHGIANGGLSVVYDTDALFAIQHTPCNVLFLSHETLYYSFKQAVKPTRD